MYFLYSILLSLGFLLMLPLFLLRRQKYASGFSQRLGNYEQFIHDCRPVIWLHCVSVGETNAARPLVERLLSEFPDHRVVISTTTQTGQELAQKIFSDKADAVIYFPFDWKFSVRRALENFRPAAILLMETEIWPRVIHEAKQSGAKIAIVNGRLSKRSASCYSLIRPFLKRVVENIDLALMQGEDDAKRVASLGLPLAKIRVTGNIKFDLELSADDISAAESIGLRFGLSDDRPLIVAASTHEREERWLLEAYCSVAAGETSPKARLLIAPRHPERFDSVSNLLRTFRNDQSCEWPRYTCCRRSAESDDGDRDADVILLDSIGELRSVYRFAAIVFVGGSLIPHGGQSILEPAAAGKAIVTGHHTHNFADAVRTFTANNALAQLPDKNGEQIVDELFHAFSDLLENDADRKTLGLNAAAVMKANRGATAKTVDELRRLLATILSIS